MIEFKITQSLESNTKILEIIKRYTYKTRKDKFKCLLKANLQFIEYNEYLIKYLITIITL